MPSHPPTTRSAPSTSGRVFLFTTGLALALLGSIFIWLMARSCLRAIDMRSWPKVPCRITESSISQRQHDPFSPKEFSHQLTFVYDWQGTSKSSSLLSLRGSKWSSKKQIADRSLARYPAGLHHQCLVNPNDPSIAVLEPDSLAPGYSIWFPALFAVGGTIMAWRALRSPTSSRTQNPIPLS